MYNKRNIIARPNQCSSETHAIQNDLGHKKNNPIFHFQSKDSLLAFSA